MIGHLRVKSPWSQLGIFLGLFGASFILASLLMAIIVAAMGFPVTDLARLDWNRPEVLRMMKLVQSVSSVLIFLLPALAFALIVSGTRPFYFLALKPPVTSKMYLLAIVCILLAFPFVMWLGQLNQQIPLPKWMTNLENDAGKQMQAFLKAETGMDVVINVFIIAFLPALCEEICFRGALQRILINISKDPWIGILFTSILFSALHLQFQGFLPRMFLGIILGALCWYSGSLWPGIIAHFVNNAVQVIVVSYAPEYITKEPAIPVYAAFVSGLAVMGILWAYRSFSTVTYGKVYENDDLNRTNQFLA